MTRLLAPRQWIPEQSEALIGETVEAALAVQPQDLATEIEKLVSANDDIYDRDCVNLNPASNTLNPRAAAVLSSGVGPRTSLGYPGAKYEMGLEAIEQIEILAAHLATQVFGSAFAEVRIPSGAMANLMAFMATTQPGDAIIVPPAEIAGHVTHHAPGAAGLYGLEIHEAPIDAERYTVDVDGVAELAERVRPKLITIGSSLNLDYHDVAGLAKVAKAVGAKLLFDAAHLSGPIAGGVWPDPLEAGADLITMSTYKSLAGPTAGLVVTNSSELAQRIEAIAFPGLTANFDAGKTAALAITLSDWLTHGADYANQSVSAAAALASNLIELGVPVHKAGDLPSRSHAFALDCSAAGGGSEVAHRLRTANLLTSAIGLPGKAGGGLRLGTNEIVRWGATSADMNDLADLIARAFTGDPELVANDVSEFRRRFTKVHYVND